MIVRLLCPIFFRNIGPGVKFYGRIRFPFAFRNVDIGANCVIGDSVFFQTGKNSFIRVGGGSSINTGCHLVASESISIGCNVAIAEYVSIRDQEHRFDMENGVAGTGYNVAPIVIESNTWIGRGAYIGPGSVIRSGSIVGANSVVKGQFPPNTLIAGAPAKIKKYLGGVECGQHVSEISLPPDSM